MSRTYKTDPLRVKMIDNREGDFPIKHNHANGVCDVEGLEEKDIPRFNYLTNNCGRAYNYYSEAGIKHRARHGSYRDILRDGHRAERTKMRNALSKVKYYDSEGFEDFDLPDYKGTFDIMWEIF